MVEFKDRRRPIQKKFFVSAEEELLIRRRMEAAGTRNFSNFVRQVVLDGRVLELNVDALNAHRRELNAIGDNINQIARKVNYRDSVTLNELEQIKEYQKIIKSQLTQILREGLKVTNKLEKGLEPIKESDKNTFEAKEQERQSRVVEEVLEPYESFVESFSLSDFEFDNDGM